MLLTHCWKEERSRRIGNRVISFQYRKILGRFRIYRSIELSWVMHTIVYSEIIEQTIDGWIISSYRVSSQHGFVHMRSITTNHFEITDYIRNNIKKRGQVDVVHMNVLSIRCHIANYWSNYAACRYLVIYLNVYHLFYKIKKKQIVIQTM